MSQQTSEQIADLPDVMADLEFKLGLEGVLKNEGEELKTQESKPQLGFSQCTLVAESNSQEKKSNGAIENVQVKKITNQFGLIPANESPKLQKSCLKPKTKTKHENAQSKKTGK